ncbi:peptidoglycan editing factor PgeF [Litoribrevibacter euphylliae]
MSEQSKDSLIWADWPAPAHIKACVSTRYGGFSDAPYESLNMGDHVGDDPSCVVKNRAKFLHLAGLKYVGQWLNQVHGIHVVDAEDDGKVREGDAVKTDRPNVPCVVMTADCLPVFFTDKAGSKVAVAHAGWRGLASGILEATIESLGLTPETLMVWLGPAISRHYFEVGPEVRREFIEHDLAADKAFHPDYMSRGKYYADLYELARLRLNHVGVTDIYGGQYCTWQDDRFYSYRREGTTGRMASMIWIKK